MGINFVNSFQIFKRYVTFKNLFKQIELVSGWSDHLNSSINAYYQNIKNAVNFLGSGLDLTQEQRFEVARSVGDRGMKCVYCYCQNW